MRRGVKLKYLKFCEYLFFLNLFGGIGLFALYPYYSHQGKPYRNHSDASLVRSAGNEKGVGTRLKDTIIGNSNNSTSSNTSLVTIVLWTTYFFEDPLIALGIGNNPTCPVKCLFTSDRNKLDGANAVVFHSRDIKSFPANHKEGQIWIYLNQESPANSAAELKDLPNVFNWTMTYRRDSDVYHPYREVVPIKRHLTNHIDQYLNSERRFTNSNSKRNYDRDDSIESVQKTKSKLIAWVVSNCNTQSNREEFVKQLEKYVPVDIYGNCGYRHCQKNTEEGCFPEIQKEYKFYLSFENSLCEDYVTEKFFNILNTSMVPIVYGGADYSTIAPAGSYINAMDFNTTKDLAIYLLYLDTHPEEYAKYFKWKMHYKVVPGSGWCSLCAKLHQRSKTEWKLYTNLWRWWYFKSDNRATNYQSNDGQLRSKTSLNSVGSNNVLDYSLLTDDTEINEQLTPMCFHPQEFSNESFMFKIFGQLRKFFYMTH